MPLQAGGTVLLEIDDTPASAVMRGGPQQVIEHAAGSFEEALARIKPVAEGVIKQFADVVHGTNSVKLKFGIKFTAQAGAIIAAVGSEANFEIEVQWTSDGGK
jgi:hypothetical protein